MSLRLWAFLLLCLGGTFSYAAPNPDTAAALNTVKQARQSIVVAALNGQGQVILGNPKATATVAFFHDYRCGYCRKLSASLHEQLPSMPNVRVVVQQMAVLGEESMNAAIVVLGAQQLGAGVAAHEALVSYSGQAWDVDTLCAVVAKAANLNAADLKKAATSSQTTDTLETSHQLGEALGVQGTPALFSLQGNVMGAPSAGDLKVFLQKAARL